MLSFISRLRWGTRAIPALTVAILFTLVVFPTLVAYAATVHLSTDPFTQATCAASATTNHHTEVEPDTFSNGSTIVATFQVGRISDGGSCAIGFATSTNNGATWTSGLLPGITKYVGSGPNDRATDPSVAFDVKHGVWLISSLTLLEAGGVHGNGVVTSRSTDGGLTWITPLPRQLLGAIWTRTGLFVTIRRQVPSMATVTHNGIIMGPATFSK